jgi:hypothetical protein
MKALGFLTFALLFLGLASEAAAQTPTPTRVGTFRDWSSYSYTGASGKICYAATQPTDTQPRTGADGRPLNRDPVFFMITTRPGEQIREEPSVIIGYPFAANSRATVTVDQQEFTLLTQNDAGWVENPALEAALVQAMRAGRTMTVRGTSQRGTNTIDTISLLGVTAALSSVATECPTP